MKTGVTLLFFLISFESYSYNHRRCTLAYKDYYPFGMLTSTTGFSSSSGDCAMIGAVEERKQQFLAFNIDELRLDSSRGGGEYVEAYASLSGCSLSTNSAFSKALQHNFTQIYGSSAEHDVGRVYDSIEQIISGDPILSKECKIRES